MEKSIKVILVSATVGLLGTLGLTRLVSADSRSASMDIERDDIAQMHNGEDESEENESEEELEGVELQSMATITLQQAIQAAENAVEGRAIGAELEEEGSIVYAINVGDQEVLIDASSDQVISSETEGIEASTWQSLATITLQQAIQAAESSTNGQAYSAELEEEDGLVYSIAIANQEIYVDAGNGLVLYTETEGQAEDESNHPRSSVQVP